MPAKVRYSAGDDHLEVEGHGCIHPHNDGFIAANSVAQHAGLTALRAAARRYEYHIGRANQLLLSEVEPEHLDPDRSTINATSVHWTDDEVHAQTLVVGAEEPDETLIRSVASAVLARERCELVSVSVHTEQGVWPTWLTLRVPTRGQTVGDAVRRADAIAAVIQAALDGGPNREVASDLICAGQAEALIGTFESDWLEAKSAPYRLHEEADGFELAKDVAALANATGGIIVIGAQTKNRPAGDEIRRINECRLDGISPRRYVSLVQRKVFPKVDGFKVELIPGATAGSGIALLTIPEQPVDQKPFLVHGTVRGGRTTGQGFTWPTREGADAVAPSIDTVHALLRAGRQALAGNPGPELARVRADLQRLEDQALEPWLHDIVGAARGDGFGVVPDPQNVTFAKPGHQPVVAQRSSPGPPVDMLQRQGLLERLQECGLPVETTARGFLIPKQQLIE